MLSPNLKKIVISVPWTFSLIINGVCVSTLQKKLSPNKNLKKMTTPFRRVNKRKFWLSKCGKIADKRMPSRFRKNLNLEVTSYHLYHFFKFGQTKILLRKCKQIMTKLMPFVFVTTRICSISPSLRELRLPRILYTTMLVNAKFPMSVWNAYISTQELNIHRYPKNCWNFYFHSLLLVYAKVGFLPWCQWKMNFVVTSSQILKLYSTEPDIALLVSNLEQHPSH